MNLSLALQNSYQNVQIALCDTGQLIAQEMIDKKEASTLLIPVINRLVQQKHNTPADLHYIAVNQGPAPFTTLRVVLATANGIAFASGVPLIGLDAFDLMLHEWRNEQFPTTIVLFNAFAGEVYFAIQHQNFILKKGYMRIKQFIKECAELSGTIRFIGNGAELYRDVIEQALGNRSYFDDSIPDYCSIAQVAYEGQRLWQEQKYLQKQLLPLYLKKHAAERQ